MAQLTKKKRTRSHLSKEEFYLDHHDEEKVLMFATGLVLGVGIASTILGLFFLGGLALVAIALSLLYIECRERMREKMELNS